MEDYEAQRLENLKHKQELLAQLHLEAKIVARKVKTDPDIEPAAKKRKRNSTSIDATPQRSSARIASSHTKPSYAAESDKYNYIERDSRSKKSRRPGIPRASSDIAHAVLESNLRPLVPARNVEEIQAGWTAWTPAAAAPSRDDDGTFHFPQWPTFSPNKSPEEIIREGSFGGSYWRPLRSQKLGIVVQDDWKELPPAWTAGLDRQRYLVGPGYEAAVNKFGVVCGQSIEEWEAAGWIDHVHDVRGWFQWYCRFFQGRRCADDERQVGRWARCAGASGRWRRMLLKKYVQSGVRDAFDDGEDESRIEVSPVMHQTCHHWAFEVRQGALDEFWKSGT